MLFTQNTGLFKRLSRLTAVGICIMLVGLPAAPVQAADAAWPTLFKQSSSTGIAGSAWPTSEMHGELGLRYWFSWGNTSLDLFGTSRANQVSRLTYSGLAGNAGEIFGQATANSLFFKGNVGLGVERSGKLQDEDFPPVVTPYSSTDSNQRNGTIGYLTLDAGGYFIHTPNSRIGAFIGYNYLNQMVEGYGCTQTATNPGICASPLPAALHVITQNNDWHSMRIGVNGETHMGKWRLSGEAAVLPLVLLRGADSHLLRICSAAGCFSGPIPDNGHGWGYQLQTMLDYQISPKVSFGLGVRYWHMQTSGYTHFDGHIVAVPGAFAQPSDWQTTLFGVTAQCAMHF